MKRRCVALLGRRRRMAAGPNGGGMHLSRYSFWLMKLECGHLVRKIRKEQPFVSRWYSCEQCERSGPDE